MDDIVFDESRLNGVRSKVRADVAAPIIGAALIGIAAGTALVIGYTSMCSNNDAGLCKVPPWTLISGLVASPSLMLTWYWRTCHKREDIENSRASQRTSEIRLQHEQDKVKQDRQKAEFDAQASLETELLPSRFSDAIRLLGDPNVSTRLGGIYALEQLAIGADEQYGVAVVEALLNFVRDRQPPLAVQSDEGETTFVPNKTFPDRDVCAALVALGRRHTNRAKSTPAKLKNLGMCKANLEGIHLENIELLQADFQRANLHRASIQQSRIEASLLSGSDMSECTLDNVGMRRSCFEQTKLSNSKFFATSFANANMKGANLEFVEMDSKTKMTHANLQYATLRYAVLCGVDMSYASILGANLHDADIRGAKLNGVCMKPKGADWGLRTPPTSEEADLYLCDCIRIARNWHLASLSASIEILIWSQFGTTDLWNELDTDRRNELRKVLPAGLVQEMDRC